MKVYLINLLTKSSLCLIICIASLTENVFAQVVRDALKMPDVKNPLDLENRKSEQASAKSTYWIVYSDRDDNVLYNNSTADSTIESRIKFLDKFYVFEETENMVSVKSVDLHPEIKGWMPKSKLILADHGLLNEVNEAYSKVMIVIHTSNVISRESFSSLAGKLRFSRSPDHAIYGANVIKAKINEIYYILKESDSKLLLSASPDLRYPEKVNSYVMGWFDKDMTTIWNSMAVLQPNFKVKDRTAVKIAETEQVVEGWLKGENEPAIWEENPVSTSSWSPNRIRFFYLGPGKNPNIIRVGVFHDISTINGYNILDLIIRLREADRKSPSNLNIVFVINGKSGMRSYFSAIANAISQYRNKIYSDPAFSDPDNSQRVTVKTGAVVYRDITYGPYMIETIPLSDLDRTREWINHNYQEFNNITDRDIPDAMYLGLMYALEDLLSGHENENNVIIHVGDVGDAQREDETHISQDEIIESASKLNCQLFSFQTFSQDPFGNPYPCLGGTVNEDHKYYTYFIEQQKEIMLKSAQEAFNHTFPDEKLPISLIFDQENNLIKVDQFHKSRIKYPAQCEVLNPADLTRDIMETIMGLAKRTYILNTITHELIYGYLSLDSLLNITANSANQPSDLEQIDFYSVINALKNRISIAKEEMPTEEEFDKLTSAKEMYYLEGYTLLRSDTSYLNNWTFEILVPAQVKKNLERDFIRAINAFRNQGSQEQRRESIYYAVQTLAQAYSGDHVSCENIPLGELFPTIINCPGLTITSRYRECLSKTLKQILMEQECPQECLEILYNEIYRSYNKSKNLSYQDYVTTAFRNYIAYFIPIEFMPFGE
jgi:hypothetical protein